MTNLTTLTPQGSLQFPIDTYSAVWVEFAAIDANTGAVAGFVAYALMVGGNVIAPTDGILSTTKGRIEVPDLGVEYWFAPTVNAVAPTRAHRLQMAYHEVCFQDAQDPPEKWAEIVTKIDASNGLQNSTSVLAPKFVGPVGAVDWSDDSTDLAKVSGLTTFVSAVEGVEWGLTFRQDGTALEMLYITHTKPTLSRGEMPKLPEVIPYAASHQPARIYMGYTAP